MTDGVGKFTGLEVLHRSRKVVKVTCTEGRNHFVKNMFKTVNYLVTALHRESFGPFSADTLQPGAYRIVKEEEIINFYERY